MVSRIPSTFLLLQSICATMSSGPIRNVPRRRRAQTPFYPLIEARPSPSTSRLQVTLPHAQDVIEIFSDDEAAGQAASVIELTTTDDEVASQASPAVHREPTVSPLSFLMPAASFTIITHSLRSPLAMWPRSRLATMLLSKQATSW